MKQVFQAEDGTIFENEIDCEKYESRLAYEVSLETTMNSIVSISTSDTFIDLLREVVELGHASKLVNFINSIEGQKCKYI
jgi:hypothetical protein